MITKTLLTVGRTFLQKSSTLGTLRASIIGPTTDSNVSDVLRVVFSDATGKTAVWPLASVSNNCQEACCCLIQDRLIVSSRPQASGAAFSNTVVTEFRLPADAFGSPPTFVLQVIYGDRDSRGAELVKLQTGDVVSMTYQHTDMRVCANVRSVAGAWNPQGLFTISPETGTSHQFSCCAAPWASNELWVFDSMDGGKGVACGIFNVVAGQLKLSRTIPVIVPTGLPVGPYKLNGEDPALVAVADFQRGQILLSFTNNEFGVDGNGNVIQQMAYAAVVGVKSDGIPFGITKGFELVVSILNPCPIVSAATGVQLGWRGGKPATTIVSGATRIDTHDGQFAFNPYAQEFVYSQPSTTDPNTFKVTPGPVVLSILGGATPIPPPMATLIESPLSDLSWSGADPANAGLFMLQSGPSKDGPWTNITDHWNVQVQNLNPKQQAGEVLKVGNTFYRLNPK